MDIKQIAATLRHYGRLCAVKQGQTIHCHVIKTGLSHNIYTSNNLLSMYLDLSLLPEAKHLFDEMRQRNIVTWTSMISGYAINGHPQNSIRMYKEYVQCGSGVEKPNGFLYSAVLKACGMVGDVDLGRDVKDCVFNEGFDHDVVLVNGVLDMFVKCGCLNEAREVFDSVLDVGNSNLTTWNTMISGYCKEGLVDEAVRLFHRMPDHNAVSWNTLISGFADTRDLRVVEFVLEMHRGGVGLDEFSCPCVLKVCSYFGRLEMGKLIHCYVVKSGFENSCFSASALVDMYSNCSVLDDAVKLFDHYLEKRGLFGGYSLPLWNAMLSGYVVNEQNEAALAMILQIHNDVACMDSYTLSNALKVCINLLNLRLGMQVHGLVVVNGYGLDYVVGSVLIDLYAKLGSIQKASGLFHRLPNKDIVAWSGLIWGCAKSGLSTLAFSLFRDMVNLDLDVDQHIISSIITVCSSLASIRSGKQVHAFCVKKGYEMEGVTVTALIDMYSKCGQIEDGLALFGNVSDRDVVCWTGIIVGCAQNGRAEEAIKFFQDMIRSGLKPNEVTFLGVLTACRHSGMVKDARILFQSMKIDYRLEPHLEHYCCMVDLLGQAGHFKEMAELIAEMPFKPDKTIWSSVLSSCGTHRKTELVGKISENLLADFADDPTVYVMLSNTYAALEMWSSVDKVRESAKRHSMKEAGMSWIEVSC